jgi:hypothetical protein
MCKVPVVNTTQERVEEIPVEYLQDHLEEMLKALENSKVMLINGYDCGYLLVNYGRWQSIRNGTKKKR